jgi:hypothetical protein
MTKKITATMASYPARRRQVMDAVGSLYDQVDEIRIYLNGYENVPIGLAGDPKIIVYRSQDCRGDLSDAGKFFDVPTEGFHLSVDDDLVYPEDYAEHMTERARSAGAVVGIHGVRLTTFPVGSYYGDRESYHFRMRRENAFPVHILGTGVLCYDASLLASKGVRLGPKYFPLPHMADILFARACHHANIPLLCIPPPEANWVRQNEKTDLSASLYETNKKWDSTLVEVINNTDWRDVGETEVALP